MKINKKDVGKRLKYLREFVLEMSQAEFSDKLGIKRNSLSNYERGIREMNYELLMKLKNIFGVNINWLLTGEGKMFIQEKDKKEEKEKDYKKMIIEIINNEMDENKVKALAEFLKAFTTKEHKIVKKV